MKFDEIHENNNHFGGIKSDSMRVGGRVGIMM